MGKEQERKTFSSFSKLKGVNLWQSSNFSDDFMSASNARRNQKMKNSSMRKLFKRNDDLEEHAVPHTFDELYKHYDEQKRLIQQKQNKMNRMKNKMLWFRKNNNDIDKLSEKQPLVKRNKNDDRNAQLFPTKSLKESETNLLNKAAQLLLGRSKSNSPPNNKDFDNIACSDSPDSLQEKILHIASDEDEEAENRMPRFV